MNDDKFISADKARKILQITNNTLRSLANKGEIQAIKTSINGHRRYNISKYIRDHQLLKNPYINQTINPITTQIINPIKREKFIYSRVSTHSQKSDLERQILLLQTKYPDHKIIKDIGSGLNFKRPGLNKLIKLSFDGKVEQIVIAHKDRLCRFGFELLEMLFLKTSNCKIIVLNSDKDSPEKELVNDLISIVTVFSSRFYGLRKYKKQIVKELKINDESKI